MDRLIDLDQAAVEIERRRESWTRAGLVVRPVTWRDEAQSWPWTPKTDRTTVADPASIGVTLDFNDDCPAARVVLFRSGWADVDTVDTETWDITTENPTVPSVAAFGSLLDQVAARVLP